MGGGKACAPPPATVERTKKPSNTTDSQRARGIARLFRANRPYCTIFSSNTTGVAADRGIARVFRAARRLEPPSGSFLGHLTTSTVTQSRRGGRATAAPQPRDGPAAAANSAPLPEFRAIPRFPSELVVSLKKRRNPGPNFPKKRAIPRPTCSAVVLLEIRGEIVRSGDSIRRRVQRGPRRGSGCWVPRPRARRRWNSPAQR